MFLTIVDMLNIFLLLQEGNTPLHLAAKYGFGVLIAVLVRGGAHTEKENSVRQN